MRPAGAAAHLRCPMMAGGDTAAPLQRQYRYYCADTRTQDSNHPQIAYWDIGPFNHFTDLLMREYKRLPFDKKDGK